MATRYPGKVVNRTRFDALLNQFRTEAKRRMTAYALDVRRQLRGEMEGGAGSYPISNDTGTSSMSWYIKTSSRNDYALKRGYALARYVKGSTRKIGADKNYGAGQFGKSMRPGGWRAAKHQYEEYTAPHFNSRCYPEIDIPDDTDTKLHGLVASFWKPLYYWEYGHRNSFIRDEYGSSQTVSSPFIRAIFRRNEHEYPNYFVNLNETWNLSVEDPF